MSEGDGIDPGTVNEAVCETTVEIWNITKDTKDDPIARTCQKII